MFLRLFHSSPIEFPLSALRALLALLRRLYYRFSRSCNILLALNAYAFPLIPQPSHKYSHLLTAEQQGELDIQAPSYIKARRPRETGSADATDDFTTPVLPSHAATAV